MCASCDPSGARPLGSAFIGAKLSERASTPFHQPRSLSDDGSRLFFSSPDPLVAGARPAASVKVFEYEDGAVQLISGAEPGGVAVFLDASASGDDVFFATRERLAPTDEDELVDVYDARVDGGLPAPPAAAGACRQRLPAAAQPAADVLRAGLGVVLGLAATSPPPAPAKPTRKQLLERALAKCRKLKSRKRRAACVADGQAALRAQAARDASQARGPSAARSRVRR